jgi:hypothetical protein
MQVTLSEAAIHLKMDDLVVEPEREVSGESQALRDTNALLMRRLELADQELEARRREVQEPHVLLQQAQAALSAP